MLVVFTIVVFIAVFIAVFIVVFITNHIRTCSTTVLVELASDLLAAFSLQGFPILLFFRFKIPLFTIVAPHFPVNLIFPKHV